MPTAALRNARKAHRNLTLRYASALAVIAVMATLSFCWSSALLQKQFDDATLINLAGRQRMLSQRVCALALQLAYAGDSDKENAIRSELKRTVVQLEESHQRLLNGGKDLPMNLHEHYYGSGGLDLALQKYVANANALVNSPAKTVHSGTVRSGNPDLESLTEQIEGSLLSILDTAVGYYEENSRAKVERLYYANASIWYSTLALIGLVGWFIIRPMVNQIRELLANISNSHRALLAKDQRIELLLDSVDDGFLPIELDGRIAEGASNQVSAWFGACKPGIKFWDYLGKSGQPVESLEQGFQNIQEDSLPFVVRADQAVKTVERGERTFGIDYREVVKENDCVGYLLVIRDVTEKLENERRKADSREFSQVLSHILRNQQGFRCFLDEMRSRLELALDDDLPSDTRSGLLHAVKGSAAIYGLTRLSTVVNDAEHQISAGASYQDTVPLIQAELEKSLLPYEEYFIRGDRIDVSRDEHNALISRLLSGEQPDALLPQLKRWEFEPAFCHVERCETAARKIANQLGKEIDVRIVGDRRLRLDGDRFGAIWTTLPHLVLNAVDHGIESPKQRQRAGKPQVGTLEIRFGVENDQVVIAVVDDGAGINWDVIRAKAAENGLPHAHRGDLVDALFCNGFSSRDSITQISGRGVGMGAFKAAVDEASGRMSIESERGKGSTFTIEIPLPNDQAYEDLRASESSLGNDMSPLAV